MGRKFSARVISCGLFYQLICCFAAVAAPIGQVDVKLPFGEFFGLPQVPLGGGGGGGGGGGSATLLNLPFSDMNLPGLSPLFNRKVVALNQPPGNVPLAASAPLRQMQPSVYGGAGGEAAPLSVVNMPFSQFNLPLSQLTKEPQRSPTVDGKLELLRREEALAAQARQTSLNRTAAHNAPVALPRIISDVALKGNLDTAAAVSAPEKGSPELPIANRLTLPLAVVDAPLHAVDLPLSKFILPLSHLPGGALPLPQAAESLIPSQFLLKSEPAEVGAQVAESGADVTERADGCAPTDLVCQASAVLKPPVAINLNSLSLPYSFLNTPLGFFNLPLSFVNLPYASTNLPFAHLNLPFGFFNLPFYELMQTFGSGAALPALRDADPLVAELTDARRASPLDRPQLLPPLPSAPRVVEPDAVTVIAGAVEHVRAAPSATLRSGGDAFGLADSLIGQLATAPTSRAALADGVAASLRGGGVPAVPDLGGLFGTPYALFPSPFSLFNLPLGFLDSPLGFVNLPFSHFNLPLSHMSMPFSGLNVPVNDIKTPEFGQTVESASVELADIPPSLLQVINPDNPLQSYLNLPLAEMNMPLAIMDMPFTVFDMPFAFLNLPLAHLNTPFTHLHLPFEISSLPFANLALPFDSLPLPV